MKLPLVSVIVPTKNSANTLDACLRSIANQSYQNIEIVLVDNFSEDDTQEIAKKFTKHVYAKGPERSTQRNYGVDKSNGEYVLIIDSDMELSKEVVSECVREFQSGNNYSGLVIPEESFGEGFWAQCKKLERSFYVGVSWMEAARAFPKDIYLNLGGYNIDMISGEDWDLSQRANKAGNLGRIKSFIMHNEGHLKLLATLKKKFYYAQKISNYVSANSDGNSTARQMGPIQRYKLFFSKPVQLFHNPLVGIGMLFMKTAEFAFGAFAIMTSGKRL